MKDRQATKHLVAGSYLSREGCDFIYISDIGSPIVCHKVSSEGHSSESGIKEILLQGLLVCFLLIRLCPRLFGGGSFCDMINYTLEPLAML